MSKREIFFVLGAGASVDSGLFTYRGPQGMYSRNDITPETILTEKYFKKDPSTVWNFLKPQYEKLCTATPGPTYQKLAEMCHKYPKSFILTQNIDRLVTKNITVPIVEIHGQYDQIQCVQCHNYYPFDTDVICKTCNKMCRPDIIFFNENLPRNKVGHIYEFIDTKPEMVVIIGTSLQFTYLKTMVNEVRTNGGTVIHINPDESYSSNVEKDDIWIRQNAYDGLVHLEKILT